MSSKKSRTTTKKQPAARASRPKPSNGSGRTAAGDQRLSDLAETGKRIRRDAKNGEMTTKEVTLLAFRRTYDRLHPRKDK